MLPSNIDCLKNVWQKQRRLYSGEILLGAWISRKNQNRKCCVAVLVDFVQPVEENQVVSVVGIYRSPFGCYNQTENPTVYCRWLVKGQLETCGKTSVGPGFLGKIENGMLCWPSWWTSSNRWRKTRWSRLWECIVCFNLLEEWGKTKTPVHWGNLSGA